MQHRRADVFGCAELRWCEVTHLKSNLHHLIWNKPKEPDKHLHKNKHISEQLNPLTHTLMRCLLTHFVNVFFCTRSRSSERIKRQRRHLNYIIWNFQNNSFRCLWTRGEVHHRASDVNKKVKLSINVRVGTTLKPPGYRWKTTAL